jgi:secreted PhoX family phosphatase
VKDKAPLLHATDGDEIPSKTSANPAFASILEKRISRRDVMRGGIAANPHTGEIRRFFVGPPGQDVTGCIATPDNRTLIINVQHPG